MSSGKFGEPRQSSVESANEGGAELDGEKAPGHGVGEDRSWAQQRIGNAMKAWRKAKGDEGGGGVQIPEGGGAPLAGEVRRKMEPHLGADLAGVKVHTGGESAKVAKDLGARAFTVGNAVHFGAGEYQPGSKEGDKLIAHELTHVAQGQKGGVQRKADDAAHGDSDAGMEVSQPNDPAEHEADAVADGVAEKEHGDGKHGDDKHGGDEKHAAGDKKDVKQAPAAVSAKRAAISLAAKPGAQPAKNGPAPGSGGAAKESAGEVALKQSIEELKSVIADPLKVTPTDLEQLLRTTWTRIGYNQGPIYSDAGAMAKKAQQAWDAAKANYVAGRYNKAVMDLSPEHPMADKLLATVLQMIEKEQPQVRLFLPKTTEAVLQAKDLVRAKQEAHKQAIAAKEAKKKQEEEQKKHQAGGGADHDKKQEHAPGGGGGAQGQDGGQHVDAGKDKHDKPQGGDKHDKPQPPVAGGGAQQQAHAPVAAHDAHADAGDKQEKPDKAKAADPAPKDKAPEPPKPAAAPEPTPDELLEKFRNALTKGDVAGAQAAWEKVPASHRGLLTPEEVVHGYLLAPTLGESMHKSSLNPFAVNFALLDSPQSQKALEALHSTGQWHPFLLLAPNQGALSKKHQMALRPLVAKDKQTAQELFKKAFVEAHDGAYPGGLGPYTQTTPWQHGALVRLWDALVTAGLPAAHIGAASGGFYLVAKELEKGAWIDSSGAWYDDSIKACAFGTGAVAYNVNLDANKDKKEAHNANEGYMPFFEGSALHEVGHAVGASFGGDDWAVQRNDFKAENGNAWSQALFNYGGNADKWTSKLKNVLKGKKNVKPDDMRTYLIGQINGTPVKPPKGVEAADMDALAATEYKDTMLYKYSQHLADGNQGYTFPLIERCEHDGRIYYENQTFKSLGLGSRFVSCKKETITHRVSTYSLASHKEWFAENYMSYYKTPKALGSKVASDVKSYLDGVHKNPAVGKVAQAGGKGAAASKSQTEKQGDDKGAPDEAGAKLKEQHVHRFSFPVHLG